MRAITPLHLECCSSWKSKCNFTLDSQALYGNLSTEIHAHTHTFILLECWSRCCLSFHKTPYKFSRLAQVKVLKAKCLEYFELELVLKALNNNEVVVSLLANISRSSSPLVIYTPILIHYKDNDILYASTGGTGMRLQCVCSTCGWMSHIIIINKGEWGLSVYITWLWARHLCAQLNCEIVIDKRAPHELTRVKKNTHTHTGVNK